MEFKPFTEKQLRVLTWWCEASPYSSRDAVICDGAVRSGKTVCMAISFILWSFYRFSDESFALCGKTVSSLRRNVITPLSGILSEMGFTVCQKISRNFMEVSVKGRTNRYYFFGGKDEASASLIQGMTLCGVLFDEVALMPRSFVEQALARCSVDGSKFWFNCNPEHPRHWFYLEWIKKSEEKNTLYLHFTMEDNPSLSSEMIARYRSLYSGAFYERFVEGKWVAAEGLIYPFMTEKGAACPVPDVKFEKYYISGDYGTVNPTSFGLWGKSGGVWYRIDEYYYNSRSEGSRRTDEEHYASLLKLAGERNIEAVIVDPSAASFIEVIKKHGKFSVIAAKNEVLDGIRRVSNSLREGRIRICETCENALREFSLYRWDNRYAKDMPQKENDHAMDDIRYFVSTVADVAAKPGFFAFAA
ncbi:MAG: PBSX family phage terminase large subunit, partial [Clostridia bacterium]|nr:PBSX family phage terminase large subunit [Clostridia bacterium]